MLQNAQKERHVPAGTNCASVGVWQVHFCTAGGDVTSAPVVMRTLVHRPQREMHFLSIGAMAAGCI
jgi:hypothetical protein